MLLGGDRPLLTTNSKEKGRTSPGRRGQGGKKRARKKKGGLTSLHRGGGQKILTGY